MSADVQEEDLIEREMMRAAVTEMEFEQRVQKNVQESQCTMQQMLNQPYMPPSLHYEKKIVQPKETAYVQKAARLTKKGYRHNPEQLVRGALNAQNERFKHKLEDRDSTIYRQ